MVREVAVDFAEQRDDFAVQRFDQLRGDHAGRAVAAVDHDFQAAGQFDVLDDFGVVAVEDFDLSDAALAAAQVIVLDALVEHLNLLVGEGVAGDDDFEAVVVRRIVATGEHHPGLAGQHIGGVVQCRRWHQADIADVATALGDAANEFRDQLRAGQATVTTDRHVRFALSQALRADGATDPVGGFTVEVFRHGATNVVGAENAVRQRRGDLGGGAHLWTCSISKRAGQTGE